MNIGRCKLNLTHSKRKNYHKKTSRINIQFREGSIEDLAELKKLAIKSWRQFQTHLTDQNWSALSESLNDEKTYKGLLEIANCLVCIVNHSLIGMAYLVPSGKSKLASIISKCKSFNEERNLLSNT